MDPKLLNCINVDLKWNTVKRERRTMTRRPRKPGDISFESGDKRQDPGGFEFGKSGTDVLGQHLAEKVVDAPLKKRRLLHQSPSPPPPPACPDVEGCLSPGPQTPAVHHEDLGQRCSLNSLSQSQKTKSKFGLRNSNLLKLTKKDAYNLDDFSGIELLAAAACSSFIHDDVDHIDDLLALKEHTTPGVHLCSVDLKEVIIPTESDGSSIQDSIVPDTYDHGNEEGEKKVAPSKELRLHWDLNTVMDEWEKPCNDFLAEPQIHENCSEGDSKSGKMNLEGCESRCAEVVGAEEKSMLDGVYVNQSSVKHDGAIAVVPLNKNWNGDSFGKTYGDMICSQEVMGTKTITSKTSDGESSATKSDVVDSVTHPGKCEDFSTSTTSVLQEQTMVKCETDTIDNHLVQSLPKITISKSVQQPVCEEAMQGLCQSPKLCKSYVDNKVTSEDPVIACCGSNVAQDERGQMAVGDTMDKVQVGYDSPFEDGELREPIGWEENEVEEKEIVCYESDNIHKDESGSIEIPSSGNFETSCDHVETMEDQTLLLVKEVLPDIDIKQDAQAGTCSEVSGCQLELVESDCGTGRDFCERKNGNGESRPHGGKALHIDESTSFDACGNGAYAGRSRSGSFGDHLRSGRDFGTEKSVGRDKVSFQDSCRNDVRVWDLKSSHSYHRPKNVTGDPIVRSVGCRILDSNQSRNYDPRSVYRTQNRRSPPSERTNSYGIHRGLSRDRYRGGSGFHPQRLRRAPEEEYRDPKPRYLERKASCFSPNFNRGGRRSRSRSRSGSPIAWHFQKQRNSDARQSPDREARYRGSFQKSSSNSGGMEAGFVSLSRGRDASPERSSKCFDDRKFIEGQFRDKRPSPSRRNQRCEAVGYPKRLKSDDHFRFTQRSGRFSQMSTEREHRYKEKHDGQYEKANRSDDVGGVRRFRYMMDDSFEARSRRNMDGYSSCFKDADMPESKS